MSITFFQIRGANDIVRACPAPAKNILQRFLGTNGLLKRVNSIGTKLYPSPKGM